MVGSAIEGGLDRAEIEQLLGSLAEEVATGDALTAEGVAADHLATLIYHLPFARSAIGRILFDPEDVEEALQETVVAVMNSASSFRHDSTIVTWITSIARFKAMNLLTAKQRRLANASALPNPASSERFSSLAAGRLDLHELLVELPPDLRQVVQLRDVDQLSYAEIANRLDLKLNTVRSRLARGRARLASNAVRRGAIGSG